MTALRKKLGEAARPNHGGPLADRPFLGRRGVCRAAEKGSDGASSVQRLRPLVLVIDDDEFVRIVLQSILGGAGYDVLLAEEGRAGLEAARERSPDIIITDLVMPEVDGLEVIRSLVAGGSQVPILAMSGGTRIDSQDGLKLALSLGAAGACEKPFDPDDILDLVRAHTHTAPGRV